MTETIFVVIPGSKSGMDTPPVLSSNGIHELNNPVCDVEEVAMTSSLSDDDNKGTAPDLNYSWSQEFDAVLDIILQKMFFSFLPVNS